MEIIELLLWPYKNLIRGFSFGGDDGGGGTQQTSGGSSIYVDPNIKRMNKATADWVEKYLPNTIPGLNYGGAFTAPMTSQEKLGMGWLDKYLTEDTSKGLTGAASDNIMKTLTGGFDPYKSDYYKAFRDATMLENRDAMDALKRDAASRNKYFSSELLESQSNLGAKTAATLNQFMTGMAESERGRQMQAIPLAQDLAQEPLRRAQAGAVYGGLPRTIANLDLEKRYQDFVRQQEEKMMVARIAGGQGSGITTYQNPSSVTYGSQGNVWGDVLGQAASAAVLAMFL